MAETGFEHERSDISARVPVRIALVMLLLLPLSIALVVGLMQTVWAPAETRPNPFGASNRPPPAAALQQNPQQDMDRLQQRWQQRLHRYGWVDQGAGIVHIPIGEAIERIAEQGLPDRDQSPAPVRSNAGRDRP